MHKSSCAPSNCSRLVTLLGLYALHIMSLHQSPGLKIVEIAHDMQLAVGQYVKQDLNLLNSFDTWHGIKLSAKSVVCFHWFNYTVKEPRMLLRSLQK